MSGNGLIGHTGFVGGNLARQLPFDHLFNSKNVEDLAGLTLDLLVISGAPAAKWLANREPEADRATIDRLIRAVRSVARAERVVLVSTVDVYPEPVEVDEATVIDRDRQHAYGRHRHLLEDAVVDRFGGRALVLRLPALFGPGLKKNAIYDLLHDNEVHKVHADGVFQFYDVRWLPDDLARAAAARLTLLNLTTTPLRTGDLARQALDLEFDHRPEGARPGRYDVRSLHAAALGGRDGYVHDGAAVLEALRGFARETRAARPAGEPGGAAGQPGGAP